MSTNGPTSVPDSAIVRMKGSGKKPLIALAVGAAVVVVVVLIVVLGKNSAGDAKQAYGELWTCAVGDALDDGETLETRMRGIAAVESDDWPSRCKPQLLSFYESLPGDDKSEAVKRLMELELGCKQGCSAAALPSKLGQVDHLARGAGLEPKASSKTSPPKTLRGAPLMEADFAVLVPGVPSLRGVANIGEQRTALLYRAQSGAPWLCELDPDGERPVKCGALSLPVSPQSTRLVEGRTESIVYGVTKLGESATDSSYGAFRAWTGAPIEDDASSLALATDRPRLPPPGSTWLSAELGGKPTKLERMSNGVLKLTRGDEPSRFVMDDSEHGGPGTGEPQSFAGKRGAVVVFQTKKGIAGLVITSEGKAVPARN